MHVFSEVSAASHASAHRRSHRSCRHSTGSMHIGRSHSLSFFLAGFVAGGAVEDVEFVDEVHHEIGVDGVAPSIGSLRGGQRSAHVALTVENVIELNADGGSLFLEERLSNLGVPNEFVGVHGMVDISSA